MADFGGYKDADGVTHPPPAIAARAIATPREPKYISLIKKIEAAMEKLDCREQFVDLGPEDFIEGAADTILELHEQNSTHEDKYSEAKARIEKLESELQVKKENPNNLQHQLGQDTPARPDPIPNDSTSASQNDMEVDEPKKLTKKMFADMEKKYAILEEKYEAANTKAVLCTCSTVRGILDEFTERLDKAIVATKADLGDAGSEYYKAEDYLEWSEKEILTLRELVSKLKAAGGEAVKEERAADRDRIADLEHDAITQMERADSYEKELKQERIKIQQMNQDKMQRQNDLTEARRVCAERLTKISQLESTVASLQDTNAIQNTFLESSRSTIQTRDATIAHSYSSSVQTNIQNLQGTISQRDATIQTLQAQVENVQAQLDRTVAEKNEAQRAHENEKTDVQSQLSSSQAKLGEHTVGKTNIQKKKANTKLNNNKKDEEPERAFQQEKKVNNMQAEFDRMRRKNEESAWEDYDESEEDEAANPTHSLQMSQPTLGNEVPLPRNKGQTSEFKASALARGGQGRVLGSTSKVGKPIKNNRRQSHTPSQLRLPYLLQDNAGETDDYTNSLSQPSKHNVVQPSQILPASSEPMASEIWCLPSRLPHLVDVMTKLIISRQENEIQQLKEAIENYKKEIADFKASIDPKTGALIDRERRALPQTKDQLTAAYTQLHHANGRIVYLEYYRDNIEGIITSLRNANEILRSDNSRLEKKSRKADGMDDKIKSMEKELNSHEKTLKEVLEIQARTFGELEESRKATQQAETILRGEQDILRKKTTTIDALKVEVAKEKASADLCRRAMERSPMFPEHNVRMLKDIRKKFDALIPDPAKVIDDLLSEPITHIPTLADCRIPCQQPSVHSLEKDEAVAPPKVEQDPSPEAVPVAQSLWNRWTGWLCNSVEKNAA
ncbi:uncharacterized protein K444DRAFT_660801 [Hyaloscypha bicolor E]|uniref:Uncharacterized protein n=1 Tax=Hyaloscypha bicolor E TaxID=1095630 RepID=A0A2J6TLH0_9HELO|nr:uncharacterized protein K444DRAFT_660801 [Hyaloscypha bicolor E]PMD63875.1 hypothetical protein K444DRAFT_660801 [Hyaloscypha bicolor E]